MKGHERNGKQINITHTPPKLDHFLSIHISFDGPDMVPFLGHRRSPEVLALILILGGKQIGGCGWGAGPIPVITGVK